MRILVVDDDRRLAIVLARWLKALGHEAIHTQDVTQAEELAREVDAVVTDVEMGSESGIDLARRIRQDQPQVPIAFCSGCDRHDPVLREFTAEFFLAKPFTPESLGFMVEALDAAVSQRRAA